MFASQGWKDFIEDVNLAAIKTGDIHNLSTIEQLHFKKGELSILEWITSIETLSRDAYDQLLEEER
jgi:hypothetical protein